MCSRGRLAAYATTKKCSDEVWCRGLLPNELRPGMGSRPRYASAWLESLATGIEPSNPLQQSERVSCHRMETPRINGTVSACSGLVWFSENTLGEVLARDPVLLSRKLAGRDLNPLNLSVVIHVLRVGSRVCFQICC